MANAILEKVVLIYGQLFSRGSPVLNVLFLIAVIFVVSLFIWQFYRSTSRRNLIKLNLNQYNHFEHPVLNKILATALYLIEYIVIMPLLIILWFSALSIVLLLIADPGREVNHILLISAALIGAIRVLAYHRQEISKDLAKVFPFIALSVFLLSPDTFDYGSVIVRASEIPLWLNDIIYFIIVVFAVEIVLRFFYEIFDFFRSEERREVETNTPGVAILYKNRKR